VIYLVHAFRMDPDTTNMIAPELPWRKQVAHFNDLFPQNRTGLMVIVVAEDPECAEDATAALFEKLQARNRSLLPSRRPDGGPYFEQHGPLPCRPQVQKIADVER